MRKQYSGNAHGIVKGIGIVTFVYYNPELDRYWVLDYRIFDPERDGKTKLDHVNEMLSLAEKRGVQYKTALMDSWYATTQMMTRLHQSGKVFYCPLKANRLVDESKGQQPYQAVETLAWSEAEEQHGKLVKVKGFAKSFYELATLTKQTVYQLKHGPLSDYLKQQLRQPTLTFS